MPMPRRPRSNCESCGKPLENPRSRFCDNVCQGDHAFQQRIADWRAGKSDGTVGRGDLSKSIKRYLLQKFDNACTNCGWSVPHPVTGVPPLQVHHIDGRANNNTEENLTLLCPNCHALTPNWGMRNKGNGREYRRQGVVVQRENATIAL